MHVLKRISSTLAFASLMGSPLASFAAAVTLPASGLLVSPNVYTANGYYTNNLGAVAVMTGGGNASNLGDPTGRNDDGFQALDLGFSVDFFGQSYNNVYLNNNGNVSFGSGISAYVPTGPTGANAPVISAFFSDVDTRNPDSGVMHYRLTSNQIIVTWDNVGYFSVHANQTNSFQMVLRSSDYVLPTGEGVIGFFYGDMGWEMTDTSTTAAVGFGNGLGDSIVIAGSNAPGMAATVNNTYIWFNANLAPVDPSAPHLVSEPASLALLSLSLLGAGLFSRRRRLNGGCGPHLNLSAAETQRV